MAAGCSSAAAVATALAAGDLAALSSVTREDARAVLVEAIQTAADRRDCPVGLTQAALFSAQTLRRLPLSLDDALRLYVLAIGLSICSTHCRLCLDHDACSVRFEARSEDDTRSVLRIYLCTYLCMYMCKRGADYELQLTRSTVATLAAATAAALAMQVDAAASASAAHEPDLASVVAALASELSNTKGIVSAFAVLGCLPEEWRRRRRLRLGHGAETALAAAASTVVELVRAAVAAASSIAMAMETMEAWLDVGATEHLAGAEDVIVRAAVGSLVQPDGASESAEEVAHALFACLVALCAVIDRLAHTVPLLLVCRRLRLSSARFPNSTLAQLQRLPQMSSPRFRRPSALETKARWLCREWRQRLQRLCWPMVWPRMLHPVCD